MNEKLNEKTLKNTMPAGLNCLSFFFFIISCLLTLEQLNNTYAFVNFRGNVIQKSFWYFFLLEKVIFL